MSEPAKSPDDHVLFVKITIEANQVVGSHYHPQPIARRTVAVAGHYEGDDQLNALADSLGEFVRDQIQPHPHHRRAAALGDPGGLAGDKVLRVRPAQLLGMRQTSPRRAAGPG